MAATAHRQHGGEALQIQIPLLDRQGAGGIHHSCELGIS
jgi:hypothetical protein